MAVLRTLIGEALRTTRLRQDRTLREVSSQAGVSLGYLSEVERGVKEASSELLASICRALGVRLSDVLRDVSDSLSVLEPQPVLQPAVAPAAPDRAVAPTASRGALAPARLPARPVAAAAPVAPPEQAPTVLPVRPHRPDVVAAA